MLGAPTSFSFTSAYDLNVFWATLNGESVDGQQSSFQIWRTHSADWQDATVNTVIHVFPWERRLVIRRIGLGALLGFVQAVVIPQMGHQPPEIAPLAQPANLGSPTMPTLEPLAYDEDLASSVDGEAAERAWQHTPPVPLPPPPLDSVERLSPALSAASLTAYEDPSLNVQSVDRDHLSTPDPSPVSSLLQLTSPPSSQHRLAHSLLGSPDDFESGPSNEALAALWDNDTGPVIISLYPETPVVRRKRRRINRPAREDRLVYPPSPIDLTNL